MIALVLLYYLPIVAMCATGGVLVAMLLRALGSFWRRRA
jgi:hypothetical protein